MPSLLDEVPNSVVTSLRELRRSIVPQFSMWLRIRRSPRLYGSGHSSMTSHCVLDWAIHNPLGREWSGSPASGSYLALGAQLSGECPHFSGCGCPQFPQAISPCPADKTWDQPGPVSRTTPHRLFLQPSVVGISVLKSMSGKADSQGPPRAPGPLSVCPGCFGDQFRSFEFIRHLRKQICLDINGQEQNWANG